MAAADDVLHALQDAMNRVMPEDDERDHVRAWRTRIQNTLSKMDDYHIDCLERDGVDREAIRRELDAELGYSITELRSNVHTLMEQYSASLEKLFKYNKYIQTKLDQIDKIKTTLNGLLLLGVPDTDTYAALQTSIDAYVRSCYTIWGIEDVYTQFIKEYTRFQLFRQIVVSIHAVESTSHPLPVCSICTARDVSCALNPCGHVFCTSCARHQETICYICRTPVDSRLQLYFS